MKRAYVFPGQGAQALGMGRDLAASYPEARAVFEEVDDALGEKLSDVIWGEDADRLTLTQNAQPALMATSIAAVRALAKEGIHIRDSAYVAGHSLGELTALCAADAIDLADTARLLRLRGQAMQDAVPVGQGAMAAILGLDLPAVEALAADAAQGDVCEAANDNAPGQVVVSGTRAAVERASALCRERGAKRAMLLPVSAPFHCALMAPAAEKMRAALTEVAVRKPIVSVVANVTAQPVDDPDRIRDLLVRQVTGRVRWRESVGWMAGEGGVGMMIEVGSGKALSGMIRRIAKDVDVAAVATPDDVRALAAV